MTQCKAPLDERPYTNMATPSIPIHEAEEEMVARDDWSAEGNDITILVPVKLSSLANVRMEGCSPFPAADSFESWKEK